DRFCFLKMLTPFLVEVHHTVYAAIFAKLDARYHGVVANLGPVLECIRHMRNQRAGFGANLAPLNAKAAINAVRAIAMRSGDNGNGSADADADSQLGASANDHIAASARGRRAVG